MGGAFCVICRGYSAFLKQTIAPICWRCSKAHSGWSPLLAIMANEPLFLPRNVPPPANKGQDSRQCVGDNRAKPQRHFLRTLTATPESYKRQTRFVLAEGHFIVNTIYIYTLGKLARIPRVRSNWEPSCNFSSLSFHLSTVVSDKNTYKCTSQMCYLFCTQLYMWQNIG